MIRAEFFTFPTGVPAGFCVGGHSGFGEEGCDIVCAAVSSAAYMAANTLTDVVGAKAEIRVENGLMSVRISRKEADACGVVLNGFRLHIEALRGQYPQNIQIVNTEV
jgi:hypothetical protein